MLPRPSVFGQQLCGRGRVSVDSVEPAICPQVKYSDVLCCVVLCCVVLCRVPLCGVVLICFILICFDRLHFTFLYFTFSFYSTFI